MMQKDFFISVLTLGLILCFIACGEKKITVKSALERVEAFAFDVNDDYLQRATPVVFVIPHQPVLMVNSV